MEKYLNTVVEVFVTTLVPHIPHSNGSVLLWHVAVVRWDQLSLCAEETSWGLPLSVRVTFWGLPLSVGETLRLAVIVCRRDIMGHCRCLCEDVVGTAVVCGSDVMGHRHCLCE